jgi:acyl transferase domain-containing protein/acyl carrier protein
MDKTGFEVAIIGMAGRFPGAPGVKAFWENIKNGVELISFFSDEELAAAGISQDLINRPDYVKANGILDDVDCFDASFFGYSPREADVMDPQMRILHECAWEALEDAGYNPESYNRLIGIYAGSAPHFNWEALLTLSGKLDKFGQFAAVQLTNKDFLCTRISYKFNLIGPSLGMYTACSTSLVAVHVACQALINGECDMALAGGMRVRILKKTGYIYEEGMIAPPDGHCRAFDADSKGVVGSDGGGMVVLKGLEDALLEGDHIYTVIKGSAINNDGIRKVGFSAPSIEGQAEVIKAALQMAGIQPESITYVEAHGTGTQLGDPVEMEALRLAFASKKRGFCAIGSAKTNIGHLDAGAGVAGLIKTALALKYKMIPASLHFNTPNPKIDFENSPFYVIAKPKEWRGNGEPLRAGVSSFGIGGTNAHVVLEEAPVMDGDRAEQSLPGQREHQLLVLSAKTESALNKMTQNLVMYLHENPRINLADVAYTLQAGRKALPYRKMTVCPNIETAIELLSTPDSGQVQAFLLNRERVGQLVLMFPGQGSQYVNMGRGLYDIFPSFRQEMDRCFEFLSPLVGCDLKKMMYPGPDAPDQPSDINRTEITQPILFAFEYALARLLMGWGITPHAMIGHSIGEYVAAHLSGVFSLEDALRLVALRGNLMKQVPIGAMLSVPLAEEQLRPLLNEELSLAASNSSSLCVVSGGHEAVDAFSVRLKADGCDTTRLHTSHAFHSSSMNPILAEFAREVSKVTINQPTIPYITNVTGTWAALEDIGEPKYWARHLRDTVRFADGLAELLKDEDSIFLEVGPGNTLSTFVNKHADKKPGHLPVNLIRHPKEIITDEHYLLNKIGQSWLFGLDIDWLKFQAGEQRNRLPLPTYPFERQRFEINGDPVQMAIQKFSSQRRADVKLNLADWFYLPSWRRSPLPARQNRDSASKYCFLVIDHAQDLGTRLVKGLKEEGHQVITVNKGGEFAAVDDRRYNINTEKPGDFEVLMKTLLSREMIPDRIVHLLSIDENVEQESGAPIFKKCLYDGFYSLLYLARAIGKLKIRKDIRIEVLTNNVQAVSGEEILCPEKSTILAPIKVIPQEYSNIKCRSIDMILPRADRYQREKLVRRLLVEFTVESPDLAVAYRGDFRWIESFQPVRLDDALEKDVPLRERGVYLITGGLGKMGFVLARYLARQWKARLILTGRSPLPEREKWQGILAADDTDQLSQKIQRVLKLEELGAEIMMSSTDIADQKQMETLVSKAVERFGEINGVIHAAGVTDPETFRFIDNMEEAACMAHFRPKVYGLYVLENVFRDQSLDFCVLASSLSAILGGMGYSAYAAANLFMDAFSQRHNLENAVPWIGVNWDGWQIEENIEKKIGEESASADLLITPAEGEQAFMRILAGAEEYRLVVSTYNLQTRIDRWLKLESPEKGEDSEKKKSSVLQARPSMLTAYVPPQNRTEELIAGIMQEFLGLDMVGRNDNFFDLGITSLDIVQLNRQLKEQLNRDISVVVWFEYSTISSLAAYLDEDAGDMDEGITSRQDAINRGQENLVKIRKISKGEQNA